MNFKNGIIKHFQATKEFRILPKSFVNEDFHCYTAFKTITILPE